MDLSREGPSAPEGIHLRPATHDDYEDVAAFTRDTWTEVSDYIPDVYRLSRPSASGSYGNLRFP